MQLTKRVVWDSDCMSSFLTAGSMGVPIILIGEKMILPKVVYDELIAARNEGWKEVVDNLIVRKVFELREISTGEEAMKTFYELTQRPKDGFPAIGRGEAAAIAIAKQEGGILASNNFKDIIQYVELYNLPLITTGSMLYDRYISEEMSEDEIETIWHSMYESGCKLPAETFSEYLEKAKWNFKNRWSFVE